MTDSADCDECGAPRTTGLVACSYCDAPYPGMPDGVSCPKCGDDNMASRPRCARCAASLKRSCLFCAMSSSVSLAACAHCGELFDGADERKRARDEQLRQQQLVGLAAQGLGVLGQVAASSGQGGQANGLLGEIWDDLSDAAMGKKR